MVLKICNLTKMYQKKHIFNNFSISINNQSYNFIIGENGCGKSTLVRCVCQGTKYYGKINSENIKISFCPDQIILPEYISIKNYLKLVGRINKIPKLILNQQLLYYKEAFNLQSQWDKSIKKLSLGTKQKILLIQTLMSNSHVYIFDEPLNGLDSDSQTSFINEIRELRKRGCIVIIVTHHLPKYRLRNKYIINLDYKDQYQCFQ